MKERCGYAWEAPLLRQPPYAPMTVTQACDLELGHDGEHRSSTNVTKSRDLA